MTRAAATKSATELISLGAKNVEFYEDQDGNCFVTSSPIEAVLRLPKEKAKAAAKPKAAAKK